MVRSEEDRHLGSESKTEYGLIVVGRRFQNCKSRRQCSRDLAFPDFAQSLTSKTAKGRPCRASFSRASFELEGLISQGQGLRESVPSDVCGKAGERGKARTQRSLQELQDQLEEFRHGQQGGPLGFDTVLI